MITKPENELRKSVLTNILNLSQDFRKLKQELLKFSWDSEELVILQRTHLKNAITKFLIGEFSNEDVIDWANIIESREDIGYEALYEDVIKQIIFELANPEIHYELDRVRAEKIFAIAGLTKKYVNFCFILFSLHSKRREWKSTSTINTLIMIKNFKP